MSSVVKILKDSKQTKPQIKKKLLYFGTCGVTFLIVVLVGLPIAVSIAYFSAFFQRIYPKVSVCNISLSGKSKGQATIILDTLLGQNLPEKITLNFKEEKFTLDSKMVNYSPLITAENAMTQGRARKFPQKFKDVFALLNKGKELDYHFNIDSQYFDSQIASIEAKLYAPPIDPQIKIIKTGGTKTVAIETGKNGQEVDYRRLKEIFINSLSCPQKEITIAIPVDIISPKISEEMANATQKRATSLLNKKLTLKLDDQNWTISDEEMISFVAFDNDYNRSKIKDFAKEFAKTINTPPENANFRFENEKVVVFKPSKEGITLDETELAALIEANLTQLETAEGNKEITIPVTRTPAEVSTGDVNSLGIKELISEGSSFFYGSIPGRIHNVNLASLKLNGILVAPGDTFSFNQSLGDVSADTGFEQAYIIKEGRTVLGDGGGVCQVSTTLFRAVMNAGLPILERQAHAYRVHYYEDDLGPGFDATVFDPTADLKFKNDTESYVLIQSSIDLKKKQLKFYLYGTKDNRTVEISKAKVWDKQPPPPDLYQDDPTLPIGTVKQVDWKAWGSKTSFDYKVTKDGVVSFEKTFVSVYRPWQAVYLRGTGR